MMIVTDHFDQTSSVINLINRKPIMATLSAQCSLGFSLTYIMPKKERQGVGFVVKYAA